jgi:hypothetical protein
MEHFGTVEVSGSALLERLDPLAAVARLRRLAMAQIDPYPREPLGPLPGNTARTGASWPLPACL